MTQLGSAFVAAAAVFITSTMTACSAAQAQSSDRQARCAVEAEAAFENLKREYGNVLQSLNVPFHITANDYQAHYSGKIGRCLLLVRKAASVLYASSDMAYLIDAGSRQMCALYIDIDGKIDTCALIPRIADTRICKGRDEFEAFVAAYMEKKQSEHPDQKP